MTEINKQIYVLSVLGQPLEGDPGECITIKSSIYLRELSLINRRALMKVEEAKEVSQVGFFTGYGKPY